MGTPSARAASRPPQPASAQEDPIYAIAIEEVLLLRVPDDDVAKHLDRVRDDDPFVRAGLAQYEGKEDLGRL